ncbi:MAG: sulfatase-like hydrolase/transferase, partial [Acidobacteria bacterium]|nr:sulfatase-like hydrolase/transferase [Acidobacteriota bacterium]
MSFPGMLPDKKCFVIAVAATSSLILFEFFLFPDYYLHFDVLDQIQSGVFLKPLKTFTLGALSFLIAGLFIFIAVTSGYAVRLLFFAAFLLGAWVEYGYQASFSRFSVTEDFANAFFAADQRIFFNSASTYAAPIAIIPSILFGVLLVLVRPGKAIRRIRPFLLVLFFGFYAVTAYVSSNSYPSVSFAAFYRTITAFPINWYAGSLSQPALSTLFSTPRRPVDYKAQNPPPNNIVMIVDESVRADHLSLNGYARQTTPTLSELDRQGFVANWKIAVAGATCSVNSNNLLFTGVSEVPDVKGEIYKARTILQYAQAMGYKTSYFDGQVSYRWLGKSNDFDGVDRFTPRDFGETNLHDVDAEIAKRVKRIVEGSVGNFIWINKFGVHSPYTDSYPSSAEVWQPVPARNGGGYV